MSVVGHFWHPSRKVHVIQCRPSSFAIETTPCLMSMLASLMSMSGPNMSWNNEPIPYETALRIGWNLPIDVVGAGVYGGIVKRRAGGLIIEGDEWPEDNRAPPAHNPVHSRGPYLDFSKHTAANRGYSHIATVIMSGNARLLEALLKSAGSEEQRRKLANLVMTGGARPLHMCGMSRGGDASDEPVECCVCLAEMEAAQRVRLLPCLHCFHEGCIDRWLGRSVVCPTCKEPLTDG